MLWISDLCEKLRLIFNNYIESPWSKVYIQVEYWSYVQENVYKPVGLNITFDIAIVSGNLTEFLPSSKVDYKSQSDFISW